MTEAGKGALERVASLAFQPIEWDSLLAGNPNAERAALNLERWLAVTGNPSTYLQAALDYRALKRILLVFGASQHLADTVIQNPELGSVLFENPAGQLVRENLELEVAELLRTSTSPSHSLDRLRFFKQKWNLAIAACDLEGSLPQPVVWRWISDLADLLVGRVAEVIWQQDEQGSIPVAIVLFGKLGGSELNYSSDIDLAFISPDGLTEEEEKRASRFCERFCRSMEQKMGRGSLYRVDLRLRPYGGTGPIIRPMRGYEAYYELYAEAWEKLALIRTRAIGEPGLVARWETIRSRYAFPTSVSEATLDGLLEMREALEEIGIGDDLKRGPGGIRDIEFLVQIKQLIHGHRQPEIRERSTLAAIQALERSHLLEAAPARSLQDAYTFLRKLEHRCQVSSDQQTHSVPVREEAREELARTMGMANWRALESALQFHRITARTLYTAVLRPPQPGQDARDQVAALVGGHAQALLQWFDVLPESGAFYESLLLNEGSLCRVKRILDQAPVLVDALRRSVPLTELLLSGEIEEEISIEGRFAKLAPNAPIEAIARAYGETRAALLVRWVLVGGEIGAELSDLGDALLRFCAGQLQARFSIVALGSFGTRHLSLNSDYDLLFLVSDEESQSNAEAQAQSLLGMFSNLRRLDAPVGIDLRLRPEGGKGLLVRSYNGLRAYDLDAMELWERFALCQARLVVGEPSAEELALAMAYALPLTKDRLTELLQMKHRIETERVNAAHLKRHVKLGTGGLSDLEWLVHLCEMKDPLALEAGKHLEMPARIHAMHRGGMIHAGEVEELLEAFHTLSELRMRLALLGIVNDTVPENPDKLNRLAHGMRLPNGNAFLRRHEAMVDRVREIYLETIERLKT